MSKANGETWICDGLQGRDACSKEACYTVGGMTVTCPDGRLFTMPPQMRLCESHAQKWSAMLEAHSDASTSSQENR